MFGVTLLSALVSTSTAGSVRLHLGECVADRDLVHDLVGIEIGLDRIVERDAVFDVYVTCEQAELHVNLDPNPHDVKGRTVTKDDASLGGPRLIALNIVELIQDGTQRSTSAPPPITVVEAEPVPIPDARTMQGWIAVGPTVRFLPQPARGAYGARASGGFDVPLGEAISLAFLLDCGFEQSEAPVTLGSVRAQVLSLALHAGPRFSLSDQWALFLMLGARGGWAWLSGQSDDQEVETRTGDGPWLGPLVGLRVRVGGRAGVTLGLEGGWTVARVYSDDGEESVGLQSGWAGVDLAVDWSFGDG